MGGRHQCDNLHRGVSDHRKHCIWNMHTLWTSEMIAFLFAALALMLNIGTSAAQTYLGVLTVPANTGQGGSCCSSVARLDASNAGVPTDGSCAGCSVITAAQYNAYQAAWAAVNASPQCNPGSIYSDGTNINVCSAGGQSATQYPLSNLGNGVTTTHPPRPAHP